ncbi:hypothetical protein ACE1AT_24805 [Pelatocladus sp. BLCC-F211]|uniref:hypothetical protein n=1 Tax=Pelatocladus sp. BLCC-F211 TaxID=3342752 RepID=UPI0035B996FC
MNSELLRIQHQILDLLKKLAKVLLSHFRQFNPDFSITDLKALFRGYRYVEETIKLLPQKPDPILLANIFHTVTNLGRIHPATTCSSGS